MIYPIPNLIIVGYGRSQILMHSCLHCGDRFIPRHDDEVLCEKHLDEKIPNENYSSVKFRGTIIGWAVEFTSAFEKRSRYNFIKTMKRDRYQCQYCGYKPGIVPEFIPLHVDHIHPFSRNGSNKLDNLTTACMTCNLLAHNKLFSDFLDKKTFILERREQKGIRRSWFAYVREFEIQTAIA